MSTGDPGNTLLQRSLVGATLPVTPFMGYYTIEGLWSGWGGVEDGRFTIEAIIPGDWSETGPGYMNHDLVNINPLWTIDENFAYNPGSDTTRFLAYVDYYIPYIGNPDGYGPGDMDAYLYVRL